MKRTRATYIAVAMMFVAVCGIVAAAVVSNTLTITTTVSNPETGITVSQVAHDGGYPNLGASETQMNTWYDTGIRLQSTGYYEKVRVYFSIDNDQYELTLDDVQLQYWYEGRWLDLPVTASDGKLEGAFGPASGFEVGPGYDETSVLAVKIMKPGTYTTNVWAETL